MMKNVLKTFLLILLLSAFCGKARAEFVTGTDDDGVFYFPQEMAEWCSLGVKSNRSYADLSNCLSKMCSDMNASDETAANDAKIRYENMVKELWVNAFILTVEIKQKYANAKLEDKAEDITVDAADSERSQNTGNSEIKKFLQGMQHDAERLREAAFDLKAYRVVSDHCDVFIQKEEQYGIDE